MVFISPLCTPDIVDEDTGVLFVGNGKEDVCGVSNSVWVFFFGGHMCVSVIPNYANLLLLGKRVIETPDYCPLLPI